MKFFLKILIFTASTFLLISCNDKLNNSESNTKPINPIAKDIVSNFLGHEYSSQVIKNDGGEASSGLYFEEKGKFRVNSYYGYETKDGPSANTCDIEGEMTELAGDLILLTQVEPTFEGKKYDIRLVMTLKLIDTNTVELGLIHPNSLSDFCGLNADIAIIGKYKKKK
jgi:hypothetical protein